MNGSRAEIAESGASSGPTQAAWGGDQSGQTAQTLTDDSGRSNSTEEPHFHSMHASPQPLRLAAGPRSAWLRPGNMALCREEVRFVSKAVVFFYLRIFPAFQDSPGF